QSPPFPYTTLFRSLRDLQAVEAVPVGVVDAARVQQRHDGVLRRILGLRQAAGVPVLDEVGDRLQRVALRVADEAHGSALDPPGRVEAVDHGRVRCRRLRRTGVDPAL